jgi:hypothetical protein
MGVRYKIVSRSEPSSSAEDYLFILLGLSRTLLACVIYSVSAFLIYNPALDAQVSQYTDVMVLCSEFVAVKSLNLQIISREATNFHRAPSCIDLFCTNRFECVVTLSQLDCLAFRRRMILSRARTISLMLWILTRRLDIT